MWTSDRLTGFQDRAILLNALKINQDLFSSKQSVFVARAPGRLDLMGGIADYSGALVLELPLAAATYVSMQPTESPTVTIRSTSEDAVFGHAMLSLPVDALFSGRAPIAYEDARALFAGNPATQWAAYVVGPLLVLMREKGVRLSGGVNILVTSSVPAGKGVSSSAAIEVATMQALCGMTKTKITGRELAILCQKAENLVVGAPCGVMDQMTSACGTRNALLALLCQPAEIQGNVKLPSKLAVWGIDSGVRHAVTGADYGSVRVGAFMGYRIAAELFGLTATSGHDGRVAIDDPRLRGYLANITPSEWEAHLAAQIPVQMTGAAFLAKYGGFTDTVTRIDPAKTYSVRQPTAHPIYENHRVNAFRALLGAPFTPENCQLLGELMYQSHNSYSTCGLGSDGTDLLVELVREAGAKSRLYGAKITGGGSGGTVAVLGDVKSGKAIERIATEYEKRSGRKASILSGSSNGAATSGTLKLMPRR